MTSSESVRLLLLTPLLTGLAVASEATFTGLAVASVATFTGLAVASEATFTGLAVASFTAPSGFCSGATFSQPGT